MTPRDLKSVRTAIWEARSRWSDIGIELEMSKTDLDVIQQTYTETHQCFNEMLCEWLKRTDPQPTWTALVDALKAPAVGLGQLAEEIKKNHIAQSNSLANITQTSQSQQATVKCSSASSFRQSTIRSRVSTAIAGFSFPHIDEVLDLDEEQKEALELRLKDESQQIMLDFYACLLYTSPSPRDATLSRMPSSA